MKDIMTPMILLSPKDDLFTTYTLMKSTGKTEIPLVEEQNGKKVLKSWITLVDALAKLE